VPARHLRVLLEGHLFRPHRRSGERFGSEADLTAMWRIMRPLEISGGASVFFPGPLLRERVGDSPRVWAYVAGVWDF
jgi:hypothetical protein